MSNEQYAFIEKAKVPTREAWQAAIDECGFDLKLHPQMKPMKDSAFSPCTLEGKESGVEIYYIGDAESLEPFSSMTKGRDYCISFRWGGDFGGGACGMILSVALAKHFGAIVSYEGGDPSSLKELLQATEEILTEFRKGG